MCAARVLEELRRIAFFDPGELFDEQENLKPIWRLKAEARSVIAGSSGDPRGEGERVGGLGQISPKIGEHPTGKVNWLTSRVCGYQMRQLTGEL